MATKAKGGKKKWVLVGAIGGFVIVALVALLLVYFMAIKPGSDYDSTAQKIKDKAISLMNDADQNITSFEAGKTTFGQADTQMKATIDSCTKIKEEANNLSVPDSRKDKQSQLVSTLNNLGLAYSYYEQYVTHLMTAQGSDDTIARYEKEIADYQNKMATTGYSFYQDSIDTYQGMLDKEKADQKKYSDMATAERTDYQKQISSCKTALQQ